MTPAGFRHGRIAHRISVFLEQYLCTNPLGVVTVSEAGFLIGRSPDTVRAPDVALILNEHLPAIDPPGYFEGAPDLAVEVISPNDRASEVLAKTQDWLAAGCRTVWVVDPHTQTVAVYSGGGHAAILESSDTLTGGDLLPGFSLPVAEIFAA
jgi:Uma2 family endonuclease